MAIAHEVTGRRLTPYEYTARIPEQIQLLDRELYNEAPNRDLSAAHDCYSFRHFTLYLDVDSTGQGFHHICFMPQFGITTRGRFHDYAQGLFAALCYEDEDTVLGIQEVFSGPCDGRFFRIRVIPYATDGDCYFTVSAWVEFWS